jgi:hypothetical protein
MSPDVSEEFVARNLFIKTEAVGSIWDTTSVELL